MTTAPTQSPPAGIRDLFWLMAFFEGLSVAARLVPLDDPNGLLAFNDTCRAVIWLAMGFLWHRDREPA